MIHPHQENVILGTGAHLHRAEFRDARSALNAEFSLPLLITPSISPNYNNNPSFTTMEIRDFKIKDLRINSLQLYQHILFNKKVWVSLDPLEDLKIDLNEPRKTINYDIDDSVEYGQLLGYEFGFDRYVREAIFGDVMVPL